VGFVLVAATSFGLLVCRPVAETGVTQKLVAQLIPWKIEAGETRMGGLKIQSHYPSEIVFTPCATNNARVHDAIGFALRPGPERAIVSSITVGARKTDRCALRGLFDKHAVSQTALMLFM
jgi:hypothetical protein